MVNRLLYIYIFQWRCKFEVLTAVVWLRRGGVLLLRVDWNWTLMCGLSSGEDGVWYEQYYYSWWSSRRRCSCYMQVRPDPYWLKLGNLWRWWKGFSSFNWLVSLGCMGGNGCWGHWNHSIPYVSWFLSLGIIYVESLQFDSLGLVLVYWWLIMSHSWISGKDIKTAVVERHKLESHKLLLHKKGLKISIDHKRSQWL